MMMIRVLGFAGVLALAVGCYHEVTDFRGAVDDKHELSDGECRLSKRSGCFEGQVTSAQDLRVKGKSFFDADSLRQRFKELLSLQGQNGMALTEAEYEINFLTPFDNRNFASGMEVYLKGDYAKSGRVMRSGKFSMHELPQGEYDIRVQKLIPFQVTYTAAAEPSEDGASGQTDVYTKTYCATLYADSSVEIRHGQRSRQVFDEYEIYLLDRECEQAEAANKISL